tara:strand:- start:372 stop:860 length:489 start_codon:yes stop_codon:yes gene_type:complete
MSDNPNLKKNGGGGTFVGNALRLLAEQGKSISPAILDIAGAITGVKGLNALGDAIRGDTGMQQADKDLLIRQIELDITMEQEITKRWEADLHSDSFWSKNIRPMTLAFLLICMFVFIMLDSSMKGFKINEEWIGLLKGLLMTAVGGYFVVRSGEKIVNKLKK